tara:strand:+ start:1253 stop:1687 length:435 start_codon:yes stop_codon:yes gene_type:complete
MYTRENMFEFAKNNIEVIFSKMGKKEQGSFLGCTAEVYTVLDRPNAEETDEDGFDIIENGFKKEIKTCWAHSKQQGYAQWYNILSKRDKCDYFIFVDGLRAKVYEVPHDVVFSEMIVNPGSYKNGGVVVTTKHNMEILSKYLIK